MQSLDKYNDYRIDWKKGHPQRDNDLRRRFYLMFLLKLNVFLHVMFTLQFTLGNGT